MFDKLGAAVARFSLLWLGGWVALLVALSHFAPPWQDVTEDAEFAFLPDSSPTHVGAARLRDAFPDDRMGSSVILVLAREGKILLDDDTRFVTAHLKPLLQGMADEPGSTISHILTPSDPVVGKLLVSLDQQAMLVVVELSTEFLEFRNRESVGRIEGAIKALRAAAVVPDGLSIDISGSTTLGRDITVASSESADAIRSWTLAMIIAILLLVYRAPLMAALPLLTLAVGVEVALKALSLLAQHGQIKLFSGIEVYTTVIVYGAGVDYCLFLTARYREELGRGASQHDAVALAIGRVGKAVAASAGTVIIGIGMLYFAEFGKFQQAGVSIALALLVVLLAALTFCMPLLNLVGRWAFWPQRSPGDGATPSRRGWRRWLATHSLFDTMWRNAGHLITRRPGTILAASFAAMLPFAILAVWLYNHVSYGLLSELSPTAPSVVGTQTISRHFPAGFTGPATLLIRSDKVDFSSAEGSAVLARLTDGLTQQRDSLMIADIRSLTAPLGIDPEHVQALGAPGSLVAKVAHLKALEHYVSRAEPDGGHTTQLEIVFAFDPFSRDSISRLNTIEDAVRELLAGALGDGAEIYFLGATPSIRDLKSVADGDRVRINVLVTVAVFLILVVLLKKIGLPVYLVLSVLYGYLVTLGVTYAVFWSLDPQGFPGLDWTVPIFLFTILVAVGEDYNIFLVSRIEEEQKTHRAVAGITEALAKTGGIISSCGFIMAGTFASLLMGGSLARMTQLGFALAFGVLLDTFIIRPILVPAFLILIERRRDRRDTEHRPGGDDTNG